MADESYHADVVATVLSLVMQHCALDAQSMCSLLQLNTACRQAVLGSKAANCSINIKPQQDSVKSMAAWLPKHAALVRGININDPASRHDTISEKASAFSQAISPVLASALQQCNTACRLQAFACATTVSAAVVAALPTTSLTRLDLGYAPANSADALQQLTYLQHLRLRARWGGSVCEYNVVEGLTNLTALTRLDIARLVTGDVHSFPTCLRELKLHMEYDTREPWPTIYEDSQEEDGELDNDAYAAMMVAARLVDLSHLPLLERCEVLLSLNDRDLCCGDYSNTITIQLAAPQLTRLLVDGNCGQIVGLQQQQPCQVQELSLRGCNINIGCLAQLVAAMPQLRDFRYDGYECNHDTPEASLECPVVKARLHEQQQLAAALGAATKLTTLCIRGLSSDGFGYGHGVAGSQQDNDDVQDEGDDDTVADVEWFRHVCNLLQLQKLDLGDVWEPHALQIVKLTALTALTELNIQSYDVPDSTLQVVKQHLTRLQVLNPPFRWIDCNW